MADSDIQKAIENDILPKHGKPAAAPKDDVRYMQDPATGRGGIALPGVTVTGTPSSEKIKPEEVKVLPTGVTVSRQEIEPPTKGRVFDVQPGDAGTFADRLRGLPQQPSQYIREKPGTTFGEYAGQPSPIGVNSREFGDLARRSTELPLEKSPIGEAITAAKEEAPRVGSDIRSLLSMAGPAPGMADIAGASRLAGTAARVGLGIAMQATPAGAGFTLSNQVMQEFSPRLAQAVNASISPVKTLLENTESGKKFAKNIPPELIELGDLVIQGALFQGVHHAVASGLGIKIAGGERLTADDIKTLRSIGQSVRGIAKGEEIRKAIDQVLTTNGQKLLTENATPPYRFDVTPKGVAIERANTLQAKTAGETIESAERVGMGMAQITEELHPATRFASDSPDADLISRTTKPFEQPPIILGAEEGTPEPLIHPAVSTTEPTEIVTAEGQAVSEYHAERERLGILHGTREGEDIFTPILDHKPIEVITGEVREEPAQTHPKATYQGTKRTAEGVLQYHEYRINDPDSPAFNANISLLPGRSLADAIAEKEELWKNSVQMTSEKLLADLGIVDTPARPPRGFMENKVMRSGEDPVKVKAMSDEELFDVFTKKGLDKTTAPIEEFPPEILDRMVESGEITREAADEALKVKTGSVNQATVDELKAKKTAKEAKTAKAQKSAKPPSPVPEFNPKDSKHIRSVLSSAGISEDLANQAARLLKHAKTPEQIRSVLEQTAASHYKATRPDEFRRMLEASGAKDSPHGWAAQEVIQMSADEMQSKLGIKDDPNRIAMRTLNAKAQKLYGKNFDDLTARQILALKKLDGDAAGAIGMTIVPGWAEFYEQDIVPAAAAIGKGLAETFKAARDLVSPRFKANREGTDAIMRATGDRNKAEFHLERLTYSIQKVFNGMSTAQQVDFIDNFKLGNRQATPQMQHVADLLHGLDDDLYRTVVETQIANMEKEGPKYDALSEAEKTAFIERIKAGTAHPEAWMNKVDERTLDYLDNHFRVLYKKIPGVPDKELRPWIGVKRSPFAGSQGFRRQHVLPDLSTGLALGGEPYSYNPMVLFRRSYADAMKYITAQRMWKSFKDLGLRKFVRKGGEVPEGFERLNDRLARVYFKADAGMVEAGEWYVEKSVAKLLNNHLSRDFVRESTLGRGLMSLKNATTAVELSISPFHAVFEAIEAASSSMALGFRELTVPGYRVQGIKDILGAVLAPEEISRTGVNIRRYAGNKAEFVANHPKAYAGLLKRFPQLDEIVDSIFLGGGKLTMHEDWKINSIDTFRDAWKNQNYIGAAMRGLPAAVEMSMKPIFEHWIPTLKIGTFAKEYAFELAERQRDLMSGKVSKPELARQIWDFVENRFGEMNFDNLFWDRTFKSIAQLNFRSVTWKLGNVKAFGGALAHVPEQLLEFGKAAKEGRAPRIDRSIAWTMSMATTTGVMSTIMTKMWTGKYPWEIAKDKTELLYNMVYPRIDANDEKQRLSMPTYFRDAVSLGRSVPEYIKHSMAGEIGRVADIWTNKDFYGTEVYDPEDPAWTKARDIAAHLIPSPFSIQSYRAAKDVGMSNDRAVMGFFGFTKAPHYISDTKAEVEMADILKRRGEFTYSKQQAEERTFKAQFARRAREGTITPEDMQRASEMNLFDEAGGLKPEVMERIEYSPGQRMFKSLELHEAKRVYDMMEEDERNQYSELLMEKIENAIEQNNVKELKAFMNAQEEISTKEESQ